MDFQSMKRKDLQALCKKHNIPANLSSLQLAQNLSSLLQEKEKPAKRGRPSSKAVVDTFEENDYDGASRQLKKVRFSPNSEMFEFVSSGHKGKTKMMTTKSERKPAAKKRANTVAAKVNSVESNEEVVGKAVRSLRSRVIASAGGGVIPVVKPPAEKKRARKVGKDVGEVESRQEFVISSARVTRSTVQTSTEDIVPVSKQIVEKKRGRGVIKDVDAVEVVGNSPVRVTRSRAQTSVEGGEFLALKPQVEKKRTRGAVKDVDADIVDHPVRTMRSRSQTSTEGGVATMPSSPIEKKRARKGIKVGAKTVKSTDVDLNIPVTLVSQDAAADRAEDLLSKRTLGQKNQKRKAAKCNVKVCENEPLTTDIGMTEQKLCLRRTTRNAVKLGDPTVLNRSTDETEMGGRGKITRSRNQLAPKDNSDMKTETAVMDQMKSETMLQAGEPLGRTGRNYNRRKSVIPRQSGSGVKVQGTSQTVPKLDEPVRRSSRKGDKQRSNVPKVDEMQTTELMTKKGDILKENMMVVPAVVPLRRSHRQTLQLESIALSDEDSPSCVTAGRKRPDNQSSKGFKSKLRVKGLQLGASGGKSPVPSSARNNSSMKQRRAGILEEQAIGINCAPLGGESAVRFTRSATKNESNTNARKSEKVVRKKQQHSRTETLNLVARTPSPEEISVIKGQPSLDAQFCMPQVTESYSDHVSGSSQVMKSSNSKNRSEARKTRSSKRGVEEAKGQTSPSKSERYQTDDVEKDKEISTRKRRGVFIFKEDVEKSSRRLTHSAVISEKNTEPDLCVKSAQKKVHGRSRPPTLVVDEDSASYGKPSLGAKFSVPKGPSDLFAGSTNVIEDDSSKRSPKSCSSTRSSKQARLLKVHAETSDVEEAKGKASSSKSGISQTYDRQEGTELSVRKQRGNVAFQEVAVDFVCASTAEESSRRLTRSALKEEKSAPANPTEKSAGKKKRLNKSEAPKLDVKISSADGNSAHGLANLVPQLSPKDLESATISVGVVIDESISKKRKKLSTSVPAAMQDSTDDVSAQILHITEGKSPILNLEETLASKSEMFQIGDLEREIGVSSTETIVASVVNVIQGEILPSDESLRGTNTIEIELAPGIELSSIQNPPGQLTSSAVMRKLESPNLEIEFPSELGPPALKAAPSIATVPELPEGANDLGLGRCDIIEDNSTSEVKNSSMVCQAIEEGKSDEVRSETLGKCEANVLVNQVALSAASEPVRLHDGGDPQMEIAVGEALLFAANVNIPIGVDRDHSGSRSLLRTGLSTKLADQEAVEDLGITDDTGFAQTTSYTPPKVREMDEPSTCKDEDSLNAESAEPYESSSSPVRKSIELEVSLTEKRDTIDELPLQDEPSTCKDEDSLNAESAEPYESSSSPVRKSIELEVSLTEERDTIDELPLQDEPSTCKDEDSLIVESAEPYESSSSPVRKSIELELSLTEKSHTIDELPLQDEPSTCEDEDSLNAESAEPYESCSSPVRNSIELEVPLTEKSHTIDELPLQDEPSTCKDEDSLNVESAEPYESSSSPVRKSIELEVSVTEKSHTTDELPLQVPVTIENATIAMLSSNKEPPELGDGKGMASTTSSYLEKQKSFVNVLSGCEADDVGIGREIIEAHSFDRKKICDGISQEMHINENQDSVKVVDVDDSLQVDEDIANVLLTPLKNTDETRLGCANREVGDCGYGIPESLDTVPAEESRHAEHPSDDDQLQTTGEEITDGISTEMAACANRVAGDCGYGIPESPDTVPAEESQHAEHPSESDQLKTTGKEITDGVGTEMAGCANREVGDCGYGIPESLGTVPAEESEHAEHPSENDQLQTTDYYQLKDHFETPASRVHSCEEETSTKVTEMTHLPLLRDNTPSTLESGDNAPLQRSLNATIDNESMEDPVGDWREDPLQSFFPTPANGGCISSKNAPCGSLAYSDKKTREIEKNEAPEGYFENNLENEIDTYNSFAPLGASDFDGDEENIHVYGGSNSVEAGENDLKQAVSDEKETNVDEFSEEQLHNHKDVIEEGHCNSSIGSWASNKPSFGTKVHITTEKTNETDNFPTDANTSAVLGEQRMVDLSMKSQMFSTQEANCSPNDIKGDEAEKSSSGLSWEDNKVGGNYTLRAEEQFNEPENKLFYGGTSDVSYGGYELTEEFNVAGDTEEYFESEKDTQNANVKQNFDGMTQEEFLMGIDHDYTVLPEPGMGGEISRMEAERTANVDDDKPMADQTCGERLKPQLGEAPSLMNSRTESPKMFSGTDSSLGSVHFALDKVQREKTDAKAEEGNEYYKQLDSAFTAIEINNATASLIGGASNMPVLLIDMKENALNLKGEHAGILSSARRMTGRRALEDLESK